MGMKILGYHLSCVREKAAKISPFEWDRIRERQADLESQVDIWKRRTKELAEALIEGGSVDPFFLAPRRFPPLRPKHSIQNMRKELNALIKHLGLQVSQVPGTKDSVKLVKEKKSGW